MLDLYHQQCGQKCLGLLKSIPRKYSSFEELKFAHGNDLHILPLRVCDDPGLCFLNLRIPKNGTPSFLNPL